MRFCLSSVRSCAEPTWKASVATVVVLGSSLAYAECSTNSLVADDSVIVVVDSVDDSEGATKLAWLLDQGVEQLLHAPLVVVSNPEPNADKEQRECLESAYQLIGGVQADDDMARVTFQLIGSANSVVVWMKSFDRHIGGDVMAVADELASLAAEDIVNIVSSEVD